jgi:hypothetical protein
MNWEDAAPEHVAWALSDMGRYMSLAGDAAAGIPLAREAVRLVTEHENPTELFLRRCDLAQILLDSGDADAAIDAVPGADEWRQPEDRALSMLLLADACYRAGRASESHHWLGQALRLIETHGLQQFAPKAAALAGHF